MARYDTFTELDDVQSEDMDKGFIGFNNRLRPDQLQPGFLMESVNGRMALNGEWQTRKGITNQSNAVLQASTTLSLPFSTFNDQSTVYTSDFSGTHTILSGNVYVQGISWVGINADNSIVDGIGGKDNVLKVLPNTDASSNQKYAYSSSLAIFSNVGVNYTVTAKVYMPSSNSQFNQLGVSIQSPSESDVQDINNYTIFTPSSDSWVTITYTITNPDSFFLYFRPLNSNNFVTPTNGTDHFFLTDITVTANNTGFTFSSLGSGNLVNQKLRLTADISFSSDRDVTDPTTGETTIQYQVPSVNDEFIVKLDTSSLSGITLASGNYKLKVVDITSGDPTYEVQDVSFTSGTPGGSIKIESPSLLDTANNEVFGSCLFSNPNDDSDNYIIVATNTSALAININTPSITYTLNYPTGQTVTSDVDMIQAFNKLFIFREGETAFVKDLAGTNINTSPTLDLVSSGTFSQPISYAVTDLDYAGGIATATASSTAVSTLSVGAELKITVAGSSGYTVGDIVTVQSIPSSTTFTFITDKDDDTNKACEVQRSISQGLGFTHMPAPKYGVYHQRRLAVPFRYSVDASANSFTDRKIFDEVLFSDILDSNTYDRVFGQFRFNAGMSDFNVGMLSFAEDKLVVFNRNSIHQVSSSSDLKTSSVQLLTDEVGLIARKSVIQVGNTILFLSDNGVYGLTFVDRYNLRGTELPISQSIDKTIQKINKENAHKAVGVYFDNRYYLAVPLDSESEDATENNAILIYNFINKSWESVDSVDDPNFNYKNLIVGGKGNKKGVYVVGTSGSIHKIDDADSGTDTVISTVGGSADAKAIQSHCTTRMFTLNSIDRKKWNNFEIHAQAGQASSCDFNLSATTENIDANLDLKSASTILGSVIGADEDVSIRGRIGNQRAYGLQIKLEKTIGRPRLRSLKVCGSETKRSTSSVQ